uniref:Uncharacterized protein n=1 Tax=Ceratitis capitata TaxID=7213 RepID=W8BP48_CERCA
MGESIIAEQTNRVRLVLPKLSVQTQLFETNFTLVEVAALKAAWILIEPKIKMISKKIAIDAYADNPNWIELFRHDEKIDGTTMIHNPLWLLHIYGDIIKTNLRTNYAVAKVVRPVLEKQMHKFLAMPHLAGLLEYLKAGVINELDDHISPTARLGLEKLNQAILYFLRLTGKRVGARN